MPATYHELTYFDVFLAATLVLVNGVVSFSLQLGLHRRLLIATVRTVTQLMLIGLVLQWIFVESNALIILLLMVVMTLIAGVVGRSSRRPAVSGNLA